jgi:uncharacterized protein YlzI (FlbEa/FlbD family)
MGGGVVVLTSDLKVPDTTIDMIRGMGGGVVNVVLTSDLKVPDTTIDMIKGYGWRRG